MAVKAVNDTAGPDGLVPTLLVYGAYPLGVPFGRQPRRHLRRDLL